MPIPRLHNPISTDIYYIPNLKLTWTLASRSRTFVGLVTMTAWTWDLSAVKSMALLTPLDLNQDNTGTYTKTALLIPSATGVTARKITREDSQSQLAATSLDFTG